MGSSWREWNKDSSFFTIRFRNLAKKKLGNLDYQPIRNIRAQLHLIQTFLIRWNWWMIWTVLFRLLLLLIFQGGGGEVLSLDRHSHHLFITRGNLSFGTASFSTESLLRTLRSLARVGLKQTRPGTVWQKFLWSFSTKLRELYDSN